MARIRLRSRRVGRRFISRLDEPHRTEIGALHALIRGVAPELEDAHLPSRPAEALDLALPKSCGRFKRTSDIDLATLRELLAEAAKLGPPYEATP